MGLLERLFGYKKTQLNRSNKSSSEEKTTKTQQNENCVKLFEFQSMINTLLDDNRYIAKSDYIKKIEEYTEVINFFKVMEKSGMLADFCALNGVTEKEVNLIIDQYLHIEDYVDNHNDKYVSMTMNSEKEYLDNILKQVDSDVMLDEDQRKVILTDEDYQLVIAGAGAGKTTTVAAKVKYLVEKRGILPSQILVVSFTNKAVNELKDKIQKGLGIDCPIATFHSTGNAIIHKNSPDEKLNIVDNSKLYFVI